MQQIVKFPDKKGNLGAIGRVSPMSAGSSWWQWSARYSDDSGNEGSCSMTERGAKICAIQACRHYANNYGKAKYKWEAA